MKIRNSLSKSALDHTSQLLLVTIATLRSRVLRERREPSRLKKRIVIAMGVLLSITFSITPVSAKPGRRVRNITTHFALDKKLSETDGREMRAKLARLLLRRDVQLFLDVIQKAEAGEPNLMVGGCRAKTLKRHPAYTLPRRCWYPVRMGGKLLYSTASGNYQMTLSNWKVIAKFLGLRNFSVTSQQLAALELIRRGSERTQTGFFKLVQGKLDTALCLATGPWASSWCSSLPANAKVNLINLKDRMVSARNNKRPVKPRSRDAVAYYPGKRRRSL